MICPSIGILKEFPNLQTSSVPAIFSINWKLSSSTKKVRRNASWLLEITGRLKAFKARRRNRMFECELLHIFAVEYTKGKCS